MNSPQRQQNQPTAKNKEFNQNNALLLKIDQLHETVEILSKKVAMLSNRLDSLESPFPQTSDLPDLKNETPADLPAKVHSDKGLWAWIGKSSLLPRLAAISFMLVMALMLRLLSDSGVVNKSAGAILGITYAALLIAWGWRLLSKKDRLAPVFPICGALLLFSITLETHAHFGSLSAGAAYILLATTLLILTMMGVRFRLSSLISLGVLGVSFTAVAIDFPNPYFPALLLLLFAAYVTTAFTAKHFPGHEWCRWFLYLIIIFAWLLWVNKLRAPLIRHEAVSEALSIEWFFPLLFAYAVSFMALPARRIYQYGRVPLFDMLAPTLTALWTFAAAWSVMSAGYGQLFWLGMAGIDLALVNFAIAAWLLKQNKEGSAGVCIFTSAAAIFLVISVPLVSGSIWVTLLAWAVIAYCLLLASGRCEIGGIRLISYFVQAAASGGALLSSAYLLPAQSPITSMALATTLAAAAGLHYRWVRKNPMVCSSGIFPTIDPNDRSGIILLFAMLINGFFALQFAGIILLNGFGIMLDDNVLSGIRSVLINSGAIGLMLIGLKRKNRELLGVSVSVALLAAAKLCGHDLLDAHGFPLVLSVFTFGLMTAVGSMVIKQWQQIMGGTTAQDYPA